MSRGYLQHGGCYISSPLITNITIANTFYTLQGISFLPVELYDFSHIPPGRLVYTGVNNRSLNISVMLSITSDTKDVVEKIRIGKNGITDIASEQSFKTSSKTDVGILATNMFITAKTNDYFEIFISCDTSSTVVTALSGVFIITAA